MKIFIILLLFIPSIVFAFTNFKTSCTVELTNAGAPKFLKVESLSFTEKDLAKSEIKMQIGPYTLLSTISQIGDESKELAILGPFFQPNLEMNIYEINPIGKSIFRARANGFRWNELKHPLMLAGFQFRDFKHDKIAYSRMDYQCKLEGVKKISPKQKNQD